MIVYWPCLAFVLYFGLVSLVTWILDYLVKMLLVCSALINIVVDLMLIIRIVGGGVYTGNGFLPLLIVPVYIICEFDIYFKVISDFADVVVYFSTLPEANVLAQMKVRIS